MFSLPPKPGTSVDDVRPEQLTHRQHLQKLRHEIENRGHGKLKQFAYDAEISARNISSLARNTVLPFSDLKKIAETAGQEQWFGEETKRGLYISFDEALRNIANHYFKDTNPLKPAEERLQFANFVRACRMRMGLSVPAFGELLGAAGGWNGNHENGSSSHKSPEELLSLLFPLVESFERSIATPAGRAKDSGCPNTHWFDEEKKGKLIDAAKVERREIISQEPVADVEWEEWELKIQTNRAVRSLY